ncbi:hypothetical protein PDJAM_G00131900, partial [Pangasius djambal]|nr:hypothetical protein [Pangasius djambal]
GGDEVSSGSSSSSRQRLFSSSRIRVTRTATRLVYLTIPAERSETAVRICTSPFSAVDYSRRVVNFARKSFCNSFILGSRVFFPPPKSQSPTSSPGHNKANGPERLFLPGSGCWKRGVLNEHTRRVITETADRRF